MKPVCTRLDTALIWQVGDRLDTDVALAHAMGCSSLLVFTGVATADAVLAELRLRPKSLGDGSAPRGVGVGEGEGGRGDGGAPLPTHAISHVGRLLELYAEGK